MRQHTLFAILVLIGVSGALVGYQMLQPGPGSDDVQIVLGKYITPISTR